VPVQPDEIGGRVIESGTGQPISQAIVTVKRINGTTDNEGRFSFLGDLIKLGKFYPRIAITVQKQGYERYDGFTAGGVETTVELKKAR